MSEAKDYTGGCHCGKVRYRATIAPARSWIATAPSVVRCLDGVDLAALDVAHFDGKSR
jgi:hypothetical protein